MSKFNLSHFKKLCANKTTLKQRILEATEYAGKYLYWFEEGTTRNVFRLNKTSVLKIAKPDYDVSENILQNKNEVYISTHYPNKHFAKVKQYDNNYIWIIMEYIETISSEKYNSCFEEIKELFDNLSHVRIGRKRHYLYDADLHSNIGIKNNKFVLVDYAR